MATQSDKLAIDPDTEKMFQDFHKNFPLDYREDVWYLTLASSLTALGAPSLVGSLFTHLVSRHPSADPLAISNRLHVALLKIFTLTGIAPVLGAVFALASAERSLGLNTRPSSEPPDASSNPLTSNDITPTQLALDSANYSRGDAFLNLLYQHNLPPIVEGMGRHGPDVMHMERHVIYGLYLADFSVLDERATELVVFPALICGGTRSAGEWHIRGARRVGMEWDDIGKVMGCVKGVADWVLGEEREGGRSSRVDIEPGRGRGEWMRWVEEVRKGMEEEEEEEEGKAKMSS